MPSQKAKLLDYLLDYERLLDRCSRYSSIQYYVVEPFRNTGARHEVISDARSVDLEFKLFLDQSA